MATSKYLTQEQFRQAYLKTLAKTIANDKLNLDANQAFIQTGLASPVTDYRTTTEKAADIEGLKSILRVDLKKITDTTNANLIIQDLDNSELKFLYDQFDAIERIIKPKYRNGVPSQVFIDFLRKYIEREAETGGLEPTIASQLEPIVSELAAERTERKAEQLTNIPDDTDWSNFDSNRDIEQKWYAIKKEIKRQIDKSKKLGLTADETQVLRVLHNSMKTIGTRVSARSIRKWSADNVDMFEELVRVMDETLVAGAGITKLAKKMKKNQISGSGLVKNIIIKKEKKEKPVKDKTIGFKQFGKHIIDAIALEDGIVSIQTPAKKNITALPRERKSKNVVKIIKTIAGGGLPSYEDVGSLSNDDKAYVHKVLKTARLSDKISIKPDVSALENELKEFEILRGQIIAGQDNKEAIKKFKSMLIKFSNNGRLAKKEVNSILSELLMLGM